MNTNLTIYSLLSIALFMGVFGNVFSERLIDGKNELAHLLGAQTVGITVGVESNDFTQIAQQVDEKVRELEMRELAVQEKEEAVIRQETAVRYLSTEIYFTSMAFILLVLVLINFYLDFKRARRDDPLLVE